MRLEDYDLAICGIVDVRWELHRERIEGLFGPRVRRLEFLVNGKGRLLSDDLYGFTTQPPPRGWVHGVPGYQHFLAMQEAVRCARNEGVDTLLWIEDDCILRDDFDETVEKAMKARAPRWDLMYYGANHSNARCTMYNDHLMRVRGSLMTHLVGIRSTVFDSILLMKPDHIIDQLFANDLQARCEAQALWPCVALQIPAMSTLWGCYTDYSRETSTRGVVE
jgi:hypothetical protein